MGVEHIFLAGLKVLILSNKRNILTIGSISSRKNRTGRGAIMTGNQEKSLVTQENEEDKDIIIRAKDFLTQFFNCEDR